MSLGRMPANGPAWRGVHEATTRCSTAETTARASRSSGLVRGNNTHQLMIKIELRTIQEIHVSQLAASVLKLGHP